MGLNFGQLIKNAHHKLLITCLNVSMSLRVSLAIYKIINLYISGDQVVKNISPL